MFFSSAAGQSTLTLLHRYLIVKGGSEVPLAEPAASGAHRTRPCVGLIKSLCNECEAHPPPLSGVWSYTHSPGAVAF